MTTLFAGPFVGEFGWELFKWQGYLRCMARDFDHVIVASRPSSLFLYRDFADELIEYGPGSYNCQSYTCFDHVYTGAIERPCDVRVLFQMQAPADAFFRGREQEFISYARPDARRDRCKIAIHARDFSAEGGAKGSRDWGADNWRAFVEMAEGLTVYSVGLSGTALHIPGTVNRLDLDGADLCALLGECSCIVGASSGTMHMAALCGCPQVVWTQRDAGATDGGNVVKYLRAWNPFRVPVNVIIDGGWQPRPETVRRSMESIRR